MGRLWQLLTRPIWPKPQPATGTKTVEVEVFKEVLVPSTYVPEPATAVVELVNVRGRPLAMDHFKVKPASVEQIAGLESIVESSPTFGHYHKFELPAAKLKDYGIDFARPGAVTAKVFWSCESVALTERGPSEPRDESVRAARREKRARES